MKIKKNFFLTILLAAFFLAGFLACSKQAVRADAGTTTAEDIQNKLDDLLQQQQDAQKQLDAAQSKLYKNQAQINFTKSLLAKIMANIKAKEDELNNLNDQAQLNKSLLAEYMRQIYYADQENPLINLPVFSADLSDLSSNSDDMASIKDKIMGSLAVIDAAKTENQKAQVVLADQQQSKKQVLQVQQSQQVQIASDVQNAQATLQEIQQKMAQLQSDLNRILGKSYSSDDIKAAIKNAHAETGVRAGFLFGMLSMESGGNPLAGNCTYKNCGMSSTRKTAFNQICSGLNFSTKKCQRMPLSCASKNYPGSGGAMGAAQFMSDTWLRYEDRISFATNDNPADPWNLNDGVMAMALYLEDLEAAKHGKTTITIPYAPKIDSRCNGRRVNVSWEFYASMRYLGWTCYGYTNYAPGVQSLANGYSQL